MQHSPRLTADGGIILFNNFLTAILGNVSLARMAPDLDKSNDLLVEAERATTVTAGDGHTAWVAAERLPAALALYLAIPTPGPQVPGPGFGPVTPGDRSPAELVERAPSRIAPVAQAQEVWADLGGFQDASEEEVAIAFHYETLADLEMIEELEMLELLAALDEGGPRG